MVFRGCFRHILCAATMVIWPTLAFTAEKSEAPKARKASEVRRERAEKPKAKAEAGPQTNKMMRVQEILDQMQKDVGKFQYEGLFLRADVKPVEGLVEFPAEKFTEQVNEIALIARECQRQMEQRQAASRAYYQKIKAPQAAAFDACGEGMREVGRLIEELRRGANRVSGGRKGTRYYLELSRLERTIAQVKALTEVCSKSMDRAELLCTEFELKPPQQKPPATVVW